MTPSTCWWSCGCTTLISAPPPARLRPLMWARRVCCLRSSFSISATQGGPFGAAGRVGQVRLVDGSRREGDRVHAGDACTPRRSDQVGDLLRGEPREVLVGVGVGGRSSVSACTATTRLHRRPAARGRTLGQLGDHDDAPPGPSSSAPGGVGGGHQRGVLRRPRRHPQPRRRRSVGSTLPSASVPGEPLAAWWAGRPAVTCSAPSSRSIACGPGARGSAAGGRLEQLVERLAMQVPSRSASGSRSRSAVIP